MNWLSNKPKMFVWTQKSFHKNANVKCCAIHLQNKFSLPKWNDKVFKLKMLRAKCPDFHVDRFFPKKKNGDIIFNAYRLWFIYICRIHNTKKRNRKNTWPCYNNFSMWCDKKNVVWKLFNRRKSVLRLI